MSDYSITFTVREEHRQWLVSSLAHLAAHRQGWRSRLREIAGMLEGEELFDACLGTAESDKALWAEAILETAVERLLADRPELADVLGDTARLTAEFVAALRSEKRSPLSTMANPPAVVEWNLAERLNFVAWVVHNSLAAIERDNPSMPFLRKAAVRELMKSLRAVTAWNSKDLEQIRDVLLKPVELADGPFQGTEA